MPRGIGQGRLIGFLDGLSFFIGFVFVWCMTISSRETPQRCDPIVDIEPENKPMMTLFIDILLIFNLCFSGVIIAFILLGMLSERKRKTP